MSTFCFCVRQSICFDAIKKILFLFTLLTVISTDLLAQFEKYSHGYPITHDPVARWMSTKSEYEYIMVEFSPTIKFSFHNNFVKRFAHSTKLHSHAQYVEFRPQFRLYSDYSAPIKTPSYRLFLSTQHFFRLSNPFPNHAAHWFRSSVWSPKQRASKYNGSVCEAMYDSITDDTDLSALLNRTNANYSMNLSALTVNYRLNKMGSDGYAKKTHSFMLGLCDLTQRDFWRGLP